MKKTRLLQAALRAAVTAAAALLALHATPTTAHAQTGVDDDRVSLPEGPGSLEGLGDDVEVDPNMGSMRYAIPIELPRGFAAATPQLALSYASGAGSGPLGIGWTMPLPGVERMTSRGVPKYTTADTFDVGGAELVQTGSLDGDLVYRLRFEGEFVRYRWVDAGTGKEGYFVADHPDGSKSYFGATRDGTLVDSARSTHPGGGTARYLLVETVDVYGHSVHYTYDDFGSSWPLLTGISWLADGAGQDVYSVELGYETRDDLLSDASVGFEELLARRLSTITVRAESEIVREYALSYQDDAAAGGFSRLARVERYGLGGRAGGELFPGVFSFEYSQALGVECTAASGCDRPTVVSMGTIPGAVDLGSGEATLIDINADGLPDVLDTTDTSGHRFFMNQLTPSGDGFAHAFSAAQQTGTSGTGSMRISDAIQVLDVDGDGLADLLNTQNGAFLDNDGLGDWARMGSFGDVSTLLNLDFALVRFIDIDDDKRIDIISSTATTTTIYHNDGNRFSTVTTDPLGWPLGGASTVQFADMNGDGLNDPVQVSSDGLVSYRLNLGHGAWSEIRTIGNLTIASSDRPLMDLEDLNGDGIADIVIVTGAQVKYALNRNGDRFDPFVTVTSADVDGGAIPDRTDKTVLYADMNGNGSEDIVWFDTSGNVTYLEPFPVRPNLLTRIDNGLGSIQRIDYGTAAEHAARAEAAGEPWANVLSIPMQVVDSIDLFVTVTGSEDGSGLHNVTRYEYRDGYYDGVEKQYRGFETVAISLEADEHQEGGTTTIAYDVGRAAPWRNGLVLEEVVESGGDVLSETRHEHDACALDPSVPTPGQLDADGKKPVYWPCELATETTLVERLTSESDWLTLRTEMQYDEYGNVTLERNLGIADASGDEDFTRTAYASPVDPSGWMLHFPSRIEHASDESFPAGDTNVSVLYYDGEDFTGLAEGQVTHGFVSRSTALASAEQVLEMERQGRDAHGNAVVALDPNATGDGGAHRRTWQYDETGLFPTVSELHLDDYSLRRESRYELDFGRVAEVTAWMRVENGEVTTARDATSYRYDAFGRLAAEIRPGDQPTTPSVEYDYDLGEPFSRILVTARSTANGAADETAVLCIDGRGRQYQTRARIDGGDYQVSGFTVYNARGAQVEVFQPFVGESDACESTPPEGVASIRYTWDATGRLLETSLPGEDVYGERPIERNVYEPLRTEVWDAEDTAAAGPHAATPTIWVHDGLERPVLRLRSYLDESGALQTARTELHYDSTNSFTGYTDDEGNRHELTVDLAERVTSVTNPSTGTTTFTYDDAGNLLSQTNATGATVAFAYDGQNRIVERFDADDRESTLVTWHYDTLPAGCAATECTNLAGLLAMVSYPVDLGGGRVEQGSDRFGYDVRRRPIVSARRLGLLADLVTTREYDNRDRLAATVHPDGTRVEARYDARSRLVALPGFVESIDYEPRDLWTTVTLADGSRLERTFDGLMRERSRTLTSGAGAAVFGHELERDRADHITAIVDTASYEGVPTADATFAHDAWYRLTGAQLGAEALGFAFDDLDRVTSATSSDTASPAHVGELAYANQPLAVTQAGAMTLSYDAAGQMTARGDRAYQRDALGRIARVAHGGTEAARLGYADADRVLQMADEDGSLVLYGFDDFEVRDGVAATHVRMSGQFVARRESTSLAARIYPNPDGDAAITAGDAFVAHLQGDESLPMRHVLAAAAARLLAEHEDATTFLHTDHLGSIVAATDEGGEVRGLRGFYPFGQVRYETGYLSPYGFTGQEHDTSSTGLIHMMHRELDPVTGRWDRFDPLFVRLSAASLEMVGQAEAGYAYVANGPLDEVDPSGLGFAIGKRIKRAFKKMKKARLKSKMIDAQNDGASFRRSARDWDHEIATIKSRTNYLDKVDPKTAQLIRDHVKQDTAEAQRAKSSLNKDAAKYERKAEQLGREIAKLEQEIVSLSVDIELSSAPKPKHTPAITDANYKAAKTLHGPSFRTDAQLAHDVTSGLFGVR